jgi:hypothetical protein
MKASKRIFTSTSLGMLLGLTVISATSQAADINAKVLPLASGDTAIMMEFDGQLLSGNGNNTNGYIRIPVSSTAIGQQTRHNNGKQNTTREGSAGTGEPTYNPQWGYVELLMNCAQYDLVLHQIDTNNNETEVLVGSVNNPLNPCS